MNECPNLMALPCRLHSRLWENALERQPFLFFPEKAKNARDPVTVPLRVDATQMEGCCRQK